MQPRSGPRAVPVPSLLQSPARLVVAQRSPRQTPVAQEEGRVRFNLGGRDRWWWQRCRALGWYYWIF